jgi:hypothetical protein
MGDFRGEMERGDFSTGGEVERGEARDLVKGGGGEASSRSEKGGEILSIQCVTIHIVRVNGIRYMNM